MSTVRKEKRNEMKERKESDREETNNKHTKHENPTQKKKRLTYSAFVRRSLYVRSVIGGV